MKYLEDVNVKDRVVIVREDLNVPFDAKGILSDARIIAALDTIRWLIQNQAKTIILSHLGRPKGTDLRFTLKPVAERLSKHLDQPVKFFSFDEEPPQLASGEVALLENVRFNAGETKNDLSLGQRYAKLGEVFVMDAFAVSHRTCASTCAIVQYASESCMGPLLKKELTMINKALENPSRPWVAVVGGGKVSTKLDALLNLIEKVDTLIVGGAIANTFLAAQGHFVGASRVEQALIPMAQQILERANALGKKIWLPNDVVVAENIDSTDTYVKKLSEINPEDQIFDIGHQSIDSLREVLLAAKTIVWNGPMGVFERPQFAEGTRALSDAIGASSAYSLAGGGETLSAIESFKVKDKISALSTGGGAFLQILEGKSLPGVAILKEHNANTSVVKAPVE